MRAIQGWCFLLSTALGLTLPIFASAANIQIIALTDSASFTPGPPKVGSLGTIFCTGLTGIQGIQTASQFPLPDHIAGVSVQMYGDLAPLLAVADFGSYQQINFQVPFGFHGDAYVGVAQGGTTAYYLMPINQPWGVFFTDSKGYAIAQHVDYSLVTPDHPARPGEVLVAYATNLEALGGVLNSPAPGWPAKADPLPSIIPSSDTYSRPCATVNGIAAEMFYAGLTPGTVGVFQMNFRVPDGTPDGDAVLNAQTDIRCFNQGTPYGYCIDGKKSVGAKIPVKSATH